MSQSTACVEGSGCQGPRECPSADTSDTGDTADTAGGVVTGRQWECGCESAAPGSGWLVILLAVALLRRFAPLVVLVALLSRHAAAGVDAQQFQPLDGGEFPALREADAGGAWEPQGALGFSYANGLVNLVDTEGRSSALLEDLVTAELGASLRFDRLVRLGVSLPVHLYARYAGEDVSPAFSDVLFDPGTQILWGDTSVWLQVPMLEGDTGPSLSWYVHVDIRTGSPWYYLGDPGGGVTPLLALSQRAGDWELLGNLGVRLAEPVFIPGDVWGVRGVYGLGLHRRITGRLLANVEIFGSVGLPPTASPGDAPAEITATVGYDLGRGLVVHAGGGTGFTTGVGSPTGRALVVADLRRRSYPDRDADGILDIRDRCPDDPEDEDGLADADGCPEADFDDDGILDVKDGCPRVPETVNGHQDEDGCPDQVTELQLSVTADAPLEHAVVTLGERDPFKTFADEVTTLAIDPGHYELLVEADGFEPWHHWLDVPATERFPYTVELTAFQFGDVLLRVTSADDVPLEGYLRRDGPLEIVPKEGRSLHLRAGPARLSVSAPGYLPRVVDVDVVRAQTLDVVVELQPSDLHLVGSRVETTQQVRFALDSAEIPPDGEGPLDDLAALLLGDPRIELLRIEGHADERGTSRYNLDLSRKRAEAIKAWLVAAGVAPGRLEAIGTGEARPAKDGETASRRVEFVVLVWADEAGKPEDPAPR